MMHTFNASRNFLSLQNLFQRNNLHYILLKFRTLFFSFKTKKLGRNNFVSEATQALQMKNTI